MLRAWLQRAALSSRPPRVRLRPAASRFASSQQSPRPGATPKPARFEKVRQKLDWWIAKSPNVFRPTLRVIRDAPVSYIVSFIVLHELTAIVPLAGLTLGFHYFRWLPSYFAEGEWAVKSIEKLGRYARRKGWIQESLEQEPGKASLVDRAKDFTSSDKGQEAVRWLIEVATAYTVVKALMPLRLLVSAWAAPTLARWTLIPLWNSVRSSGQTKSLKR
ncbi:hypothetical protein DV735_g1848, partial [Chaetothyriales sp. CBS 134920]